MVSKVKAPGKVNSLRAWAERRGDERDAIWLIHPTHTMWGDVQPVCFHRVDHVGHPLPWAGYVQLDEIIGGIPDPGYYWVDIDGTLKPVDDYGEPDSRYYSYATLFGFGC